MLKKLLITALAVLSFAGCGVQNAEITGTAANVVENYQIQPKAETASAEIIDEQNFLNSQQTDLLQNFALCCAQTLRDTQPADISQLFDDAEGRQRYINQAAYTTLAEIRSMQDKDMTLEYAEVTYKIVSVAENSSGITVELTEDNIQKFRHLEEDSYTYNTYHVFELTEKDGEWKIKSHMQEEDFFLLAQEAWNDSQGGNYAEKAKDTVQLLKADSVENFALSKQNLNEYKEIAVAKEYDREKAVEYAKEWCNKRNSNYLEYDLYGGNCQNFASQCIHAGGMDMDIKGTYTCQWKFYGKDLNYSQSATGRSYSWIGVDEFYSYAEYNTNSGLALQHDIDFKYAEKGDIIH